MINVWRALIANHAYTMPRQTLLHVFSQVVQLCVRDWDEYVALFIASLKRFSPLLQRGDVRTICGGEDCSAGFVASVDRLQDVVQSGATVQCTHFIHFLRETVCL